MRALVLHQHGTAPDLLHIDEPDPGDRVLVRVTAAPVAPLDLLLASGTSYFGPPALPYVPGGQGVGHLVDDPERRVWFTTSAGMAHGDGSLRELAVVEESRVMTLDTHVDDVGVASLGLSAIAAHGALRRGRFVPRDLVVILGAGGVVGQVAVALAADWGAEAVVAVTRGAASADRARELGATATIDLEQVGTDGLTRALGDTLQDAATLCIDPVWGGPAAAVLAAMAPGGRLVNLGDSAGPTVPLTSALVRSRGMDILGYTNVAQTWDTQLEAFKAVLEVAERTGLRPTSRVVSPDNLPQAWADFAAGAATARVVVDFTS